MNIQDEIFHLCCLVHESRQRLISLGSSKKGKSDQKKAEIEAEMNEIRSVKEAAESRMASLQKEASRLEAEQAEHDRVQKLIDQQAGRDRAAQRQNNGAGKRPNRQRDIGW